MKLPLIAVLMLITCAAARAEVQPTPTPTATPSPSPSAPPTAPTPPPTEWRIENLDATDLATINQCVMELPKRIADPFIAKLRDKLAPVK